MATNGTRATAASSRRASASATGPRSSTATRMNRNDAPHSAARVRSIRVWRSVMEGRSGAAAHRGARAPREVLVQQEPGQAGGEVFEAEALDEEGVGARLEGRALGP